MRHSNLHTHTVFSDGYYTVEETVLAAIDNNMISLGISDHSSADFDPCGIRTRSIDTYHREVRRCAEKYKDRIEVYLGLELDGYSVVDKADYDYLIGDVHYVKCSDGNLHGIDWNKENQQKVIDDFFDHDPLAMAKHYFATYVERQQINRPDVLGHFDLVRLFGLMPTESKAYLDAATEALIACLKVTPIMEINMVPVVLRGDTEPYPRNNILKEAVAHGAKLVLSSDAHKVENLQKGFDDEILRLKALGIREIVQFVGGRFVEVGI